MLEESLLFADRYKLVKLLGRGGFSEVWLAEDNLTSIQVAVKIYAPGSGLDDAGIKLFTQEFSLVFDMNHTNLLRPTHFDCWNRMPYLILPYCKNGSAFKFLMCENKMPENECWNLLHDVAAGLAYLHEKVPPLIHQDIKPDNILISDEGHYMITDFGISSRVRSTLRNGMAQEQSGGTLAYMGPERFSAKPKPIMASDVWSLGAMMYELMTGGIPPFGNHGGVLQKNGADIPIIEEDYSQELKNIVYQCLAKETWERPSAKNIEEATYNKLHGIVLPIEEVSKPIENTPEETIILTADSEEFIKVKPNTVVASDKKAQGKLDKKNVKIAIKKKILYLRTLLANALTKTTRLIKLLKFQDMKILYGGISAMILIIGVVIIMTYSGGKKPTSDNENSVGVAETMPQINYDSLAQVEIDNAIKYCNQADAFLVAHEDDKFDEKYEKVENVYMKAYIYLQKSLANKDFLSENIVNVATKHIDNVKRNLLGIYNEFEETADFLKELGQPNSAFVNRMDSIKPYIEDLIE